MVSADCHFKKSLLVEYLQDFLLCKNKRNTKSSLKSLVFPGNSAMFSSEVSRAQQFLQLHSTETQTTTGKSRAVVPRHIETVQESRGFQVTAGRRDQSSCLPPQGTRKDKGKHPAVPGLAQLRAWGTQVSSTLDFSSPQDSDQGAPEGEACLEGGAWPGGRDVSPAPLPPQLPGAPPRPSQPRPPRPL